MLQLHHKIGSDGPPGVAQSHIHRKRIDSRGEQRRRKPHIGGINPQIGFCCAVEHNGRVAVERHLLQSTDCEPVRTASQQHLSCPQRLANGLAVAVVGNLTVEPRRELVEVVRHALVHHRNQADGAALLGQHPLLARRCLPSAVDVARVARVGQNERIFAPVFVVGRNVNIAVEAACGGAVTEEGHQTHAAVNEQLHTVVFRCRYWVGREFAER